MSLLIVKLSSLTVKCIHPGLGAAWNKNITCWHNHWTLWQSSRGWFLGLWRSRASSAFHWKALRIMQTSMGSVTGRIWGSNSLMAHAWVWELSEAKLLLPAVPYIHKKGHQTCIKLKTTDNDSETSKKRRKLGWMTTIWVSCTCARNGSLSDGAKKTVGSCTAKQK